MSIAHIVTKCFDCAKCGGLCPWSSDHEPVPGWVAVPIKLRANGRKPMEDSFKVLHCPLHEPRREVVDNG